MKVLFVLLLISMAGIACDKEQAEISKSCFKGRYIETNCWPVIEVLEPLDSRLPTAPYNSFQHAVGTGSVPEKFKDGKVFYFKVNAIDSNMKYLTYCIPTKYFISISYFSDSTSVSED